jgi:hypothetical protein
MGMMESTDSVPCSIATSKRGRFNLCYFYNQSLHGQSDLLEGLVFNIFANLLGNARWAKLEPEILLFSALKKLDQDVDDNGRSKKG